MVDSRQDWELLQDYAEHGSQAAFATLVERYVHFVYSVCRREVHDAVLAEDVTQVVFLLLAKKAPTLGEVRTLSGWLFNTARFAAKSTLRQEARRAKWEQKAATDMLSECEHGTGQWDDIEPLLNEALTTLSPGEREAVFLRFCEGKSLQETGATLGVSESGAAKRISRALDKLRAYFGRHGFALSALVLTGLIKENAVEAAPASCMTAAMQIGWGVTPGLVATEVVSAQTASVKAVSLCQGVLKAMLLSKIQTGAVTILTISLLVTGGHQLARLSRAHSADLPQSIMAKSPSGKSSSVRLAPPAHVATKLSPLHRFPKWAKLTMPVRQKISVPSLSYAWLAAYGSGAATAAPLTQIGFSDPTTVGATTTGAITTGAITTDAQVIDAGSQQPNEEPAIKLGEISLTGKIQVVTLAGSRMILAVDAFTLPSGKTSRLTTPKAKTVIVNAQTALYVRHQSQQKVTLQQISLGTSAIVIGQDTGSGKPLTARLVIVWNAQQDGAFRLNPAPAPQPEKHVTTGPEDASGPRPRVGPTQPEDPQAGQAQMELLIGHMGSITALAYAPDGTLLASGSHDRTIKLWDTRTGKVLHTLDAHTDNVTTLAFSPDGNLLASGSFDRVIEIWDVQTASLRCAIPQQARTTAVVFAPKVGGNDRYLATASWDHAVRIWDIPDAAEAKPEVVWSWPQTDLEPEALAFSPDGKLLATGSWDNKVRLWDMRKLKLAATLTGHTSGVTKLSFSSDGTILASGSGDGDGSIKLWDVATAKELRTLKGSPVYVDSLALDPDATRAVISRAWQGGTQVWDATAGTVLHTLPAGGPAALSPDGLTLAVGSGTGISLWDLRTWQFRQMLAGQHPSHQAAFAPDGQLLACASQEGTVKLWNTRTGELQQVLQGKGPDGRLASHIEAVAFSPDGKLLAIGGGEQGAQLWDTQNWQLLRTLDDGGPMGNLLAVAFSPDGSILATGDALNAVKLWEVASGKRLCVLTGHTGAVRDVAFSPDGTSLASASFDQTVKLWNVAAAIAWDVKPIAGGAEALSRTIRGYTGPLSSVAFSPALPQDAHTTLVVGSLQGKDGVRLWNLATGRVQQVFSGQQKPVVATAFSPNGKLVAASGEEGIRIWGAATGQPLWVSPPQLYLGDPCLTFSRDGKRLATVGTDGLVRLYAVADMGTLRQLATLLALPPDNAQPNPAPDYLAFTPEGYYTGTAIAELYFLWRVGPASFSAAHFKTQFNRPDLVRQALGVRQALLQEPAAPDG